MSLADLRKLSKLSMRKRSLLFEASAWLLLFRVGTLLVRFERIANWMKMPTGKQDNFHGIADDVSWAIRVISFRLPGRNTCLAQALAAAAMLHRRGIPCTLNLGVARNRTLTAHAWLLCDNVVLTGASSRDQFKPISAFEIGSKIPA
jgi:hypothetical protein